MDRKNWKDFQTLVDARPDYRSWLYCKDPEEKALRKELLDRLCQVSEYAVDIRRSPLPTEQDDILFSRMSAHSKQRYAFQNFLETLFENSLRQGSEENLNLLFAFLESYTAFQQEELKWCGI